MTAIQRRFAIFRVADLTLGIRHFHNENKVDVSIFEKKMSFEEAINNGDLEILNLRDYEEELECNNIEAVLAVACGLVEIKEDRLRKLLKLYKLSTSSILNAALDHNSGLPFPFIAERLLKIQKMVSSGWLGLLKKAEKQKRADAIPYLRKKAGVKQAVAPKPDWVRKEDSKEKVWEQLDRWDGAVFSDKEVGEVLEDIKQYSKIPEGADDEFLQSVIEEGLATVSLIEHKIDPDCVFGPLNAAAEWECPTGIKGGCRMLSCSCHDEDWFTGECEWCERIIADVSHVIRFPLEGGGWEGCYCSLKCLTESTHVGASDLLLEKTVFTLKEKGVLDRS